MTDENKKDNVIHLKILGADNSIVHFRVKKSTPMKKLMHAYCDRMGLAMPSIRFRFDGQGISESDTPTSLQMDDADTIEVYQAQTGGCKE